MADGPMNYDAMARELLEISSDLYLSDNDENREEILAQLAANRVLMQFLKEKEASLSASRQAAAESEQEELPEDLRSPSPVLDAPMIQQLIDARIYLQENLSGQSSDEWIQSNDDRPMMEQIARHAARLRHHPYERSPPSMNAVGIRIANRIMDGEEEADAKIADMIHMLSMERDRRQRDALLREIARRPEIMAGVLLYARENPDLDVL